MRQLLLFLAWMACVPLAAAEPVPENAMKAAFLYNFALFTEWPQHSSAINLCISADNALSEALGSIEGREVHGMHLNVIRTTAITDVSSCQILFLGEADLPRARDVIARIGNAPVLTVTDVDGLLEQGVMIDMFESDKRLAFGVNLNATKRAGLTFSSKLLRLARRRL